jgi:tetratricopeptide (TPR) repeat protein
VVRSELGRLEEAEKLARRALELIQQLRAEGPADPAHCEIEIHCLNRLGSYLTSLKRADEAVTVSRQAVDLAGWLAAGAPQDPERLEQWALCHHNHANALVELKRASEAVDHYRKAIEIRERTDPMKRPGVIQRLSQCYSNLGVIHWKAREFSRAEEEFRRALAILDSKAPDIRLPGESLEQAIGLAYVNWSAMLFETGRLEDAILKAGDGIERIDPYVNTEPNDAGARRIALSLHGNRALALSGGRRHAESARDWEQVIRLADQPAPLAYRLLLAIEVARNRERGRALGYVQELKSSDGIARDDCYNVACVHALCAAAARADNGLRPEQRGELEASHVAEAKRWLEAAVAAAGPLEANDVRARAREDPDLRILGPTP